MKLVDKKLALSQLLLDPNNYRLDYDSNHNRCEDSDIESQQQQTQNRLEKERLGELRDSILQNGFLEMDRIVVRPLKVESSPQFYVVVEGNRRAAAFKGLIEDYRVGSQNLPRSLIEKANSIGTICVEGGDSEIEEFSATLMGIRHVSGPKRWAGYQSARLISDLVTGGKSLTEAGSLLGISAIEAGRRMRGYHAFLQLREDNKFGNRSAPKHYALLLEFLTPTGRNWLDWNEENLKFNNLENTKRLYSAITSNEESPVEIKNPASARKFIAFLASDQHRELLESGTRLNELPELDDGDNENNKLLEECLKFISSISLNDISIEEKVLLQQIVTAAQIVLTGEVIE